MKTRKKILLTGASGTVGREVLKQLSALNNKYEVTVFDVKSANSIKTFKPFYNNINIVYGNIGCEEDVMKVSYNQNVVIHLAAIIPPLADEKPTLSYQVNTQGTANLIKFLALNSPNAFFLYSSSISVYGGRLHNPWIKVGDALQPSVGDEYAKTKIMAENIIKNCRLDWSIFRLTAIMGGHKISKLMFHQPLKTSLEIATPTDAARAFVNAIEKQNQLSKKIFNLGGGENCRILYDDFLQQSFKIFGFGKLDFPPKTFADRNFHCGYYQDGDILEDILHFRQDTLTSYFENEKTKVSLLKKTIISIFRNPIKKYLQRQSEPLSAYYTQNKKLMERYFFTL